MTGELSTAARLAVQLVGAHGRDRAHRIVDRIVASLSTAELAAVAAYWDFWARPKQLPPADDNWRSFGLLTSRGFGKTRGHSEFVNAEAASGRAMLIGLCAQNEQKTIEIQVLGPSGLLATAPPWARPVWESTAKQLLWPNGARAYVLTPEAPGNIRGVDYHLAWLSEIQSWPAATRDEAFSNFMLTTRLGYGRTVWDATPKRRHPILRELVARSEAEPDVHVIRRGTIHENAANLSRGVIEDLERQIGTTTVRGREELFGESIDDAEAIFHQAWIDAARRHLPDKLTRRIIVVDPSITSDRRYSDRSGIADMGLGVDGQIYAIRNLTGRHRAEDLGKLLVGAYLDGGCSLMLIETNRGGTMTTGLVRLAARERGQNVVELDAVETPPARPGTVYVREINNRGKKADRLAVAATVLERGRCSFVFGGEGLDELEGQLCALDGGERGPDDGPDAFAMGCAELSGSRHSKRDMREGFVGLAEAARRLNGTTRVDELARMNLNARGGTSVAAVLTRSARGRAI